MNSISLVSGLRRLGIDISASTDKIHCHAPKGVVTPKIHMLLIEHREAILAVLRAEQMHGSAIPESQVDLRSSSESDHSWPTECLECEKKMGQEYARLFPLLGKMISTSIGTGILWQVFENRAAILVADRLIFVCPDQVYPPNERTDPISTGGKDLE
jgi:hypothetical protein